MRIDLPRAQPLTVDRAAGDGTRADRAKDHDRLRDASRQFESIFIGQLLQVMRESVQHESVGGVATGEEMFAGIFDDAMARQMATRMERGLGDVMYRQLAQKLDGAAPAASGDPHP